MITIKNQESQKPYHSNRSSRKKKPWSIYGVSVPGAYHLQNEIPCQDSHSFGVLNKFWKYAIVCDGAGSLENSDLGSEFLTSIASKVIKKTLSKETWYHSAKIPDETSWSVAANKIIKELFRSLWQYAQKIEINYKSMGATVNLMVFNDNGYLSVHVGDGRATVLTSDNEWIAAIKPFKGENAGETVFITSEYTGCILKNA
ncbi:MAG: protein phosphatase 2C domain-containing protein [Saprospiraceae bacterium]|nr:protein phosphatase 2C domain-containing protein [Saprospiraceae bacterium]